MHKYVTVTVHLNYRYQCTAECIRQLYIFPLLHVRFFFYCVVVVVVSAGGKNDELHFVQ